MGPGDNPTEAFVGRCSQLGAAGRPTLIGDSAISTEEGSTSREFFDFWAAAGAPEISCLFAGVLRNRDPLPHIQLQLQLDNPAQSPARSREHRTSSSVVSSSFLLPPSRPISCPGRRSSCIHLPPPQSHHHRQHVPLPPTGSPTGRLRQSCSPLQDLDHPFSILQNIPTSLCVPAIENICLRRHQGLHRA